MIKEQDKLKEQIIECGEQLIKVYQSYVDGSVNKEELRKAVDNFPEEVIKIFQSNSYYQLQADSEGLLADAELCRLGCTEYPAEEDIKFDGGCGSCGLGRKLKKTVKAQKAVDDSVSPHDKYLKAKEYLLNKIDELEQEKAEAVKKVFDWADKRRKAENGYLMGTMKWEDFQKILSDYEAFKKKTLEELK